MKVLSESFLSFSHEISEFALKKKLAMEVFVET